MTKAPEKMRAGCLLTWGVPILITVSYGILAIQADLRVAVPALVAATAVVTILLAVTLYWGQTHAIGWTPAMVILVAACLRFLFLFRPPELSDDIYRHIWDGLQALSGRNPYSLPPAAFQAHHGPLGKLLGLVNHQDLVTVYPPAAQFISMAGSALSSSVLGLKSLLVAMDLCTCVMILRLLSILGLPTWQAVLYAWHPLPILEISASGHIDGAGVLFFVLALFVTARAGKLPGRSQPSSSSHGLCVLPRRACLFLLIGLTLACSGFVKLYPFIFLPGFLILFTPRDSILFIIGAFTGIGLLTFPFLPDIRNVLETLLVYGQHWEFGNFLYRSLRDMAIPGLTVRWALGFTFLAVATFLYGHLYFKNIKTKSYRFSEKALLPLLNTLYKVTLTFLLLTPTLHPWYALYLVCLLPFVAGPAGLTFTWSVFLGYRVIILYAIRGQWVEDDMTSLLTWIAPAAACCFVALSRLAPRMKDR